MRIADPGDLKVNTTTVVLRADTSRLTVTLWSLWAYLRRSDPAWWDEWFWHDGKREAWWDA